MIGHVSPHHERDGITISCGVSVLITSGQTAWGCCSLGSPAASAPSPADPSAQLSERQQRHPLGRAAEHHSRQLCRALHTQDWWCNTSHCTGTNCFVSALRIGAQAQSHLFYISLLMNANTGL